jgi:hypothetical protein
MNQPTSIDPSYADEDILSNSVSDEALEGAAGTHMAASPTIGLPRCAYTIDVCER